MFFQVKALLASKAKSKGGHKKEPAAHAVAVKAAQEAKARAKKVAKAK